MLKANKGLMGSFKPIKEDESEYSHLILMVDEYNDIVSEINSERNKCFRIESKYKNEITKLEEVRNYEYQDYQKKIAEYQSEYKNKIQQLQDQLQHEKELNDNLLRISKERANAKRGIKPKKERSGFIALSLEQYVYVMKSFGNTKDIPCWKLRIQTPYDSSLEYAKVQTLVGNNHKYLLGQCLGVNSFWSNKKMQETSVGEIDELFKDKTIVFNTKFRANIKQGFWEVEYLVNKVVKISEELCE